MDSKQLLAPPKNWRSIDLIHGLPSKVEENLKSRFQCGSAKINHKVFHMWRFESKWWIGWINYSVQTCVWVCKHLQCSHILSPIIHWNSSITSTVAFSGQGHFSQLKPHLSNEKIVTTWPRTVFLSSVFCRLLADCRKFNCFVWVAVSKPNGH